MAFSQPELQLDVLRRNAKRLRRDFEAGEPAAVMRIKAHPPLGRGRALQHSDFLFVIAREQSFSSWPALKLAADTIGLDRAARLQRLKVAIAHGQLQVIEHLLDQTPDLAKGVLGLEIALYHKAAVQAALEADPKAAVRALGPKTPMLHLCYSKWIHAHPELEADMLAIAEMLLALGADVNDSMAVAPGSDHRLSALYGAVGHADNMVLAAWLLQNGASPNDGESLYHATELGHHRGLRLLLEHGASPKGTNAMLRAIDFDDVDAVKMLIKAGADVNEFRGESVGGERPIVVPALHQVARRLGGAAMITALLDAGADTSVRYRGASAYAFARVFGNIALAKEIEARGQAVALTASETLLTKAADGIETPGAFVDPQRLEPAYRDIIRQILHIPGKLGHVKRLVALGVEYDRADAEGLTPVQVAGWEGLDEVLRYFLSLKPDLSHVNAYGGTLLSTIIHGSENCPARAKRDYISCLRLVLQQGVALPKQAISAAGQEDVSAYLAEWAVQYPSQVIEGT